MVTKAFLVEKAFEELALAGYTYDIKPDETQSMASTIEVMVANWLPDGVQLPFSFAADPSSVDVNADSGVPLVHIRTVIIGAAIDKAASFGKSLKPNQVKVFTEGYSRLLRTAAFPPPVQLPNTLPVGAGGKRWATTRNPFMPPPDLGPLQPAEDGGLNFGK